MTTTTPGKYRRIQQLVSNEYPSCTVEFLDSTPDEIAFQIRAKSGVLMTHPIHIYKRQRRLHMNKIWLKRKIDNNRLNTP